MDKPNIIPDPSAEVAPGMTADQVLLSEKEIAEAKAEARRLVAKDMKESAKKALIKIERERLERELAFAHDAGKELVQITIDLAPYTDRIVKNAAMKGERVYMHGRTYEVTREVAATLLDDCAKTWRHQAEIDGKGFNFYRERQSAVSGKGGAVALKNVEGLRL